MFDLYTGEICTKRIIEYVKYHIYGDTDCEDVLLKAYIKKHNYNEQQIFDLCHFFAITYCPTTAIILLQNKNEILKNIDLWVDNNKNKLMFQSDRKYVKLQDRFNKCLKFYKKNLTEYKKIISNFTNGNTIILEKGIKYVQNWYYFARFSAFLFLETYCYLTDKKIENFTIPWEKGNTATSGILNVFNLDNSANYFDKNNKLPKNIKTEQLNKYLNILKYYIRKYGGNDNVTYIETSLCAYRKHFKGSRYNGYYLDRQLEEIYYYKNQTQYKDLICDLLALRYSNFDKKMLGEVNGWNGIRNHLKKSYIDGKGILYGK